MAASLPPFVSLTSSASQEISTIRWRSCPVAGLVPVRTLCLRTGLSRSFNRTDTSSQSFVLTVSVEFETTDCRRRNVSLPEDAYFVDCHLIHSGVCRPHCQRRGERAQDFDADQTRSGDFPGERLVRPLLCHLSQCRQSQR